MVQQLLKISVYYSMYITCSETVTMLSISVTESCDFAIVWYW